MRALFVDPDGPISGKPVTARPQSWGDGLDEGDSAALNGALLSERVELRLKDRSGLVASVLAVPGHEIPSVLPHAATATRVA